MHKKIKIHELGLKIQNKFTVKTDTLDAICKKNGISKVDIVKIDTEGLEDAVYRGMKNIIQQNPDLKIVMEFTASDYKKPEKFFDELKGSFDHIYSIGGFGLHEITGYEDPDISLDDWVMLLLANQEITR